MNIINIDKNQYGWWATVDNKTTHVHSDGIKRDSTRNIETGKYTGYFKKKKHLLDAILLTVKKESGNN